jgi:hypothetical protein
MVVGSEFEPAGAYHLLELITVMALLGDDDEIDGVVDVG